MTCDCDQQECEECHPTDCECDECEWEREKLHQQQQEAEQEFHRGLLPKEE